MISLPDIERALARPAKAASSDYDHVRGLRPKPRPLRDAAVLMALIKEPQGLSLILTRRAAHLRHHPGQVAFPGGKVEDFDNGLWAAALREADEEIGLKKVRRLGALQPHESVTGFAISPQLGVVEGGFTPRPDPAEVEEVFTVPLDFLMDAANMRLHQRGQRGYLAIPYGPHYIWGASARMIHNLAERL